MNKVVLFTSIGRRVSLVRHFMDSGVTVVGVDRNPRDCATRQLVSKIYEAPEVNERGYIGTLGEICRREGVNFLIPLYEPELPIVAASVDYFNGIGVKALVTPLDPLSICMDKYRLYEHMRKNGILTPETYLDLPIQAAADSQWVVKPRVGMGSRDVYIGTQDEMFFYKNKVGSPIFQRFIQGQEYSIDVFVDSKGKPRSIVPRARLAVRSGEVVQSITVNDSILIEKTRELLSCVSIYGPATIQGIKEAGTDRFYFIEINARFGGGVPLAIQAGIPYAKLITDENSFFNSNELLPYQSKLKMLRYDEAIYYSE